MVVKAIIEDRVDIYSYRIRIPILNKISSASNPTSYETLSVAPVCTIPGVEIIYNKGDVVFVAFENDDLSEPVIIGQLAKKTDGGSYTSIFTSTLNVGLTANLPVETSIGSNTSQRINTTFSSVDAVNSLINSDSGGGSVEEATQEDVDNAESIFN